jgi:hypothetical protein
VEVNEKVKVTVVLIFVAIIDSLLIFCL